MSIRRMTMCKYCKIDETGDNIGKPLMTLNSQVFGTKVIAETRLVGENILSFSIFSLNSEYFVKGTKIKYCPMCGRELKSE